MKSKREKMMMTQEKVARQCVKCKSVHILLVDSVDFSRWKGGELIQDVMPYLSADDREILISNICGLCFDQMFGEGEDDEYGDDDLTL
jgi:hypothetical protein|tara:strand:+ start:322 stop:585 length:264 start_codon:yes stop_codon:yes gene_type:complete